MEQNDINKVLGEIVNSLSAPDNEIVMRYYFYYQRIADIAAVMGLTPENVREAVKSLDPFAVDVSSGIETDGKKDHEKMKAFTEAVRSKA